eukprot:TRINITY_DN846_c0_g2_i2.p1 TRINITY_DN846_c0_g2~~TRINITY_DN846_c0_g2_i2.p1  ORF type:complete len:1317 (+),score=424.44 TRINITY_DN846_c0_g2_i2:225-4175(+)
MALRFCTSCGSGLPTPAPKFCTKCGTPLPASSSVGSSPSRALSNRGSSPSITRTASSSPSSATNGVGGGGGSFGVTLKKSNSAASSLTSSPTTTTTHTSTPPTALRRATVATGSSPGSPAESGGNGETLSTIGKGISGFSKKVKGEITDLKKDLRKDFSTLASSSPSIMTSSSSSPSTTTTTSTTSSPSHTFSHAGHNNNTPSKATDRLHRISSTATGLLAREEKSDREKEIEKREKELEKREREREKEIERREKEQRAKEKERLREIKEKEKEREREIKEKEKERERELKEREREKEQREREVREREQKERELREREREVREREREVREREQREKQSAVVSNNSNSISGSTSSNPFTGNRVTRATTLSARMRSTSSSVPTNNNASVEENPAIAMAKLKADNHAKLREQMERDERAKEDAERKERELSERRAREAEKMEQEREREREKRERDEKKEREKREREEREKREREERERERRAKEERDRDEVERRDKEQRERRERERREREEREYKLRAEKDARSNAERERMDREWREREERERRAWEERELERERARKREVQEREDLEKRERERRDKIEQERRDREEKERRDRDERVSKAREQRQREQDNQEREDRERAEREKERERIEQQQLQQQQQQQQQQASASPGETLRKHGTGKKLPPVPQLVSPGQSPRSSFSLPSASPSTPPAVVPAVTLINGSGSGRLPRPVSFVSPLATSVSPRASMYNNHNNNNATPAEPAVATSVTNALKSSPASMRKSLPVQATPSVSASNNAAAAGLAAMLAMKAGGPNPFGAPKQVTTDSDNANNNNTDVSDNASVGSGSSTPTSGSVIVKEIIESQQQENEPHQNPQQRKRVVDEIIETEADYVRDLNVIINVYVLPLRSQGFSKDLLNTIFSNVETLFQINTDLLASLQGDRDTPDLIGNAFIKVAPFLKMYSVYCANHETSIAASRTLQSENKRFAAFAAENKSKPECRHLDLAAFLIKPVQRICKYPLLLRELLKLTAESHSEAVKLTKALDAIKVTIDAINTKSRTFSSTTKVAEIAPKLVMQKKTKGGKHKGGEQFNLLEKPSRRFVSEGPIAKISPKQLLGKKLMWKIDGYYFLFNDLFLFTKPLPTGNYRIKHIVSLAPAIYNDVEMEGHQFTFDLQHVGEEKILLCAQSAEQKEKLKKEMQDIIASVLAKKYDSFVKRRTMMHEAASPRTPGPAAPSFEAWKKDLESRPVAAPAEEPTKNAEVFRFVCTDPSNNKKVIKIRAGTEATLVNLQADIRRKFELAPPVGFNIVYPRSDGTWQMMPILDQSDLDTVVKDKISDLYLSWLA